MLRKLTTISESRRGSTVVVTLPLGLLHFDLLLTLVWALVESEPGGLLCLAKTRLED